MYLISNVREEYSSRKIPLSQTIYVWWSKMTILVRSFCRYTFTMSKNEDIEEGRPVLEPYNVFQRIYHNICPDILLILNSDYKSIFHLLIFNTIFWDAFSLIHMSAITQSFWFLFQLWSTHHQKEKVCQDPLVDMTNWMSRIVSTVVLTFIMSKSS